MGADVIGMDCEATHMGGHNSTTLNCHHMRAGWEWAL